MRKRETRAALEKSCAKKWAIRIKTTHPDKDRYDGVVLAQSESLVVLQEEVSFEFDGIHLLPRSSIKSVRDGKYDACCNAILRHNGKIRTLSRSRWIRDLPTLPDAIRALQGRKVWPAVETVTKKKSALYIGPILDIDEEGFTVRSYDAAGRWEDDYPIAFAEVFRVEFWSAYTTHFNAYMKSLPGSVAS